MTGLLFPMHAATGRLPRARKRGFSLVETMVVIVILAVAIIPLVNAFAPGFQLSDSEGRTTVMVNRARGTLNRVLCFEYEDLERHAGPDVDLAALFGSSEEALREVFTFDGQEYVPTIGIKDASGATGGLLQISVSVDQVALSSLRAEY